MSNPLPSDRVAAGSRRSHRRHARRLAASLLVVGFLAGALFAGYAFAVANHVQNGIRHGCPYDSGCTSGGLYGDGIRHGYTRSDPVATMEYGYVAIYRLSDNAFFGDTWCTSCLRADRTANVAPAPECNFRTYHSGKVSVAMPGHNMYTDYYPC